MSTAFLKVDVPVPSSFLCPISLEIMRDPVIVSSGQTFDRSSIEKWLDDGHCSCPITRQALQLDEELIPNHVLRKMIQSWCVENRSLGIERISTPRVPASFVDFKKLVDEISASNANLLGNLHGLCRMAQTRPRTRRHMVKAGMLSALASSLSHCVESSTVISSRNAYYNPRSADKRREMLRLLALLSETEGAAGFWESRPDQISAMARFVIRGEAGERQDAVLVLGGIPMTEDTRRSMGATEGFMGRVVEVIKETWRQSPKVSVAGLKVLIKVCCGTRNRVVATESGAVDAMVEMLGRGGGRTRTELALKAMQALCGCAEGRAAMCRNARGIEEVVGRMNGVSTRATKHALETLWLVLQMVPGSWQIHNRAIKAGAHFTLLAIAQCNHISSPSYNIAAKILNAFSFPIRDHLPGDFQPLF